MLYSSSLTTELSIFQRVFNLGRTLQGHLQTLIPFQWQHCSAMIIKTWFSPHQNLLSSHQDLLNHHQDTQTFLICGPSVFPFYNIVSNFTSNPEVPHPFTGSDSFIPGNENKPT